MSFPVISPTSNSQNTDSVFSQVDGIEHTGFGIEEDWKETDGTDQGG